MHHSTVVFTLSEEFSFCVGLVILLRAHNTPRATDTAPSNDLIRGVPVVLDHIVTNVGPSSA